MSPETNELFVTVTASVQLGCGSDFLCIISRLAVYLVYGRVWIVLFSVPRDGNQGLDNAIFRP